MSTRTDCIYCGADTGSKEHIFPCSLGGRRVNRGILCGPCNQGFSLLDELLEEQLNLWNGLIGVRPDRDRVPKPARIQSTDGPLLIDRQGRPTLVGPRVQHVEVMPSGQRKVSLLFGSENQAQKWRTANRKRGEHLELGTRAEGVRYLSEHLVSVQWSFGGTRAFREIGRIALNFLAHRWPNAARHEALQSFKHFVLGHGALSEAEEPVWYAAPDEFPLPPAVFPFGHQILLVISPEWNAYARVRFFSTFDLVVSFGCLQGVPSEAVTFDIDPLAEHPPNDIREKSLSVDAFPNGVFAWTDDARQSVAALLDERVGSLSQRIDDRHWQLSTQGLLERLNAARDVPLDERLNVVVAALEPHKGRVLSLLRHAAHEAGRIPDVEMRQIIHGALDFLLSADAGSVSGLSPLAHFTLEGSFATLAMQVTTELADAPLTDERLRLLLAGGAGAVIVVRPIIEQLLDALKPSVEREED